MDGLRVAGEDESAALGCRRCWRWFTLWSGQTTQAGCSGQAHITLVTTLSLRSIGSGVAHLALVTAISNGTSLSLESNKSWCSSIAFLALEPIKSGLTTISGSGHGVGVCYTWLTLGANESVHAIDSTPAGVASGSPWSWGTHPSVLTRKSGISLLALGAIPARFALEADISDVALPADNGISRFTALTLATHVAKLSLWSD